MTHQIQLTDKQMLFYQLNIIHDIIHDYGFYAAETRWQKNAANVRQYLPDRFTLVIEEETNEDDDEEEDDGAMSGGMSYHSTGGDLRPGAKLQYKPKELKMKNLINKQNIKESIFKDEEEKERYIRMFKNIMSTNPYKTIKYYNNLSSEDQRVLIERLSLNEKKYLDKLLWKLGQNQLKQMPEEQMEYKQQQQKQPDIENDIIQMVRRINSNFVQQVKNTPIFNFFQYLTTSRISIDLKTQSNQSVLFFLCQTPQNNFLVPTVEFAYNIIVPTNTDDYETGSIMLEPDQEELDKYWNSSFFPNVTLFDLYCCIADNFADFLLGKYGENIMLNTNTIFRLFNDINIFLDSTAQCYGINMNIINCCVLQSVGTKPNPSGGGKNRVFKGGAITTQAEYDRYKQIADNVYGIAYGQLNTNIESIINSNELYNEVQKNAYDELYSQMATAIAEQIKIVNPSADEKQIYNKIYMTLPARPSRNTLNIFKTTIDKGLDGILKPIQKDMSDYIKATKAIELQRQKEDAKATKAAEKAAKELDKQRKTSGKADSNEGLGELDSVRTQFLNAVAILGLYLNGIFSGTVSPQIGAILSGTIDDAEITNLVKTELGILYFYAGYTGIKDYIEPKGKKNLDKVLIDAVKIFNTPDNWYAKNGGKYFCNKSGLKTNPYLYIIDNAAKIPTEDRDNDVFCPLSSIVDGMNQCTLGTGGSYSANSKIEYGNMNFTIHSPFDSTGSVSAASHTANSPSAFYKGILTLSEGFKINSPPNNIVTYEIIYKGFTQPGLQTSIENIVIKNGKIRNLEAHNVLKNTLVSILSILINLLSNQTYLPGYRIGQYLTTNQAIITPSSTSPSSGINPTGFNIFKNIINIITQNVPDTIPPDDISSVLQNNLLQSFFTILGKGAGDIFQEINTVCKHGGYISPPVSDTSIIPWNSSGNAMRCFAANDRPSACRFIFLNKYGNDTQINTLSFGGYISNDEVITTRTNGPVCMFNKIITGGSIKRKNKTKKFIKIRNSKKHYKHILKKYSKKHNNSNLHKKTRKQKQKQK